MVFNKGILSAFLALSGVWYDLAKASAQVRELEAARATLKRACELNAGLRLLGLDDLNQAAVW